MLKEAGVWVVGLDAAPEAVPLAKADLTGPLALVVGAEGAGLTRLVREHCDWLLAIPMYGKVASLNAAVAGSVVLVAARQARSGAASGADVKRSTGLRANGAAYLTFDACAAYTGTSQRRMQSFVWRQRCCLMRACADVAQSAEHRPCKSRVAGSIPAVGLRDDTPGA